MIKKPMQKTCAICGKNRKLNNEIYDVKYVIPGRGKICDECLKDYQKYDDAALEKKIREKLLRVGSV